MTKTKKAETKPDKKIMKAAKEFLYAHATFCAFDCCDSMHLQENWEHTFGVLTEDTEWEDMDIEHFIEKYMPEEIENAKANAVDIGCEEIDWEDTPSEFLGKIKDARKKR